MAAQMITSSFLHFPSALSLPGSSQMLSTDVQKTSPSQLNSSPHSQVKQKSGASCRNTAQTAGHQKMGWGHPCAAYDAGSFWASETPSCSKFTNVDYGNGGIMLNSLIDEQRPVSIQK